MISFGNDWDEILKDEWEKPYYKSLREFLREEYKNGTVYPAADNIFSALKNSSFENTKVVIIGQDPYHEPNQAHGLCFSVKEGVKPPPSLVNIYKEIKSDTGIEISADKGDLTAWAKQGVLLLNTVLTVRKGEANSHKSKGWEIFTDRVISALDKKEKPVVFLLWGANARKKAEIIENPIHFKFTAAHPSPLSAYNGFFGCRHFSKCNNVLTASGQTPINWEV